MPDITDTPEFVAENADRLISWEYVHGVYCYGKKLRPSKIAERVGMQTHDVQNEIKRVVSKAFKSR